MELLINRGIKLVVIDYYTKWVEIVRLNRNPYSDTVV